MKTALLATIKTTLTLKEHKQQQTNQSHSSLQGQITIGKHPLNIQMDNAMNLVYYFIVK